MSKKKLETCRQLTSPSGAKVKLCVKGGKFGYSGWLHGSSGKAAHPVSTGNAQTAREALDNGEAFINRVWTKRN